MDERLESSLARLAGVVFRDRPLADTLAEVTACATTAIPGADGVGLATVRPHRSGPAVASTDFVRVVDETQYRLGEGPCLTAVETRAVQVSGSLGGETRWKRFGPRAGRLGVHSALSLPLVAGEQLVGSLNVYGHARDAFDARAVRIGERFSGPAAVTAANAIALEEARRLAEQLDRALGSRAVIDQSIGILMSRSGVGPDEAFESLRRMSQLSGTKLADVSRRLVDQAAARARERHAGDPPEPAG